MLFIIAIFILLTGLLALDPGIHARFIDLIASIPPSYTIGGGLALGIISLILLNLAGRDPNAGATFRFESKKGPVEISLRALEDYITKHFADKPVVHSVRTRVGVSRDRKKIRVRASVSVWSEQGLKDAGEKVQEEIARCLSEGLGLDNVENVHVSVDKIIASKPSKSGSRLFRTQPPARASVEESPRETVVKFTRGEDKFTRGGGEDTWPPHDEATPDTEQEIGQDSVQEPPEEK